VGNWKREKIGDRGAESLRFRYDYLCIFLISLEYRAFASTSPACAGSRVSVCSHTPFSETLLIPPLPPNSALMDLPFVLFSHHPRTERPRSQHSPKLLHLCQLDFYWYQAKGAVLATNRAVASFSVGRPDQAIPI